MKTLIAIPCMDTVPVTFMTSMLNLHKSEDTHYGVNANSLIYDSRNTFVVNAIDKGYDRVLWIDSDMVFKPDMLDRLSSAMTENNLEYVAALCFKRTLPTAPVVYSAVRYDVDDDGIIKAGADIMYDYPQDSLFEVAGTGFGAVLVKTDLMRRVWDTYGPPFQPMLQMGEDLSFCWRVHQLGVKMYCDSRVKVGHSGLLRFDERLYQELRRHGVFSHGAADGTGHNTEQQKTEKQNHTDVTERNTQEKE